MYIGLQEGWKEFKSAVCELASGELLLFKEEDCIYFSTNSIYCNYAGYLTDWKNFIGYQNVIFHSSLGKLKDIVNYSGVKNIVYEEKELQDFLERSAAFGLEYIFFEDVKFMEQINTIIKQAKPFYEEIKKARLKEQFASFLKKELDNKLPVFYADLLLLKSLMQPRFAVGYHLLIPSMKKELSRENIVATWKANVIS